MTVEFRQTSREDVIEYYGDPLPYTIRAVSAVLDGRVVGISGIYPQSENNILFSNYAPELREYPVALVKGAHMAADIMKRIGVRTVAVEQHDAPKAGKLLERLGMYYVRETTVGKVWGWHK